MIQTSTTTTNSLQNNMAENGTSVEDLGEDEQSFYLSITKTLNEIVRKPRRDTIAKILNYSKNL